MKERKDQVGSVLEGAWKLLDLDASLFQDFQRTPSPETSSSEGSEKSWTLGTSFIDHLLQLLLDLVAFPTSTRVSLPAKVTLRSVVGFSVLERLRNLF